MAGFIFGGNTGINSAADLARQREIVNTLLARQQAPRNVGEGLSALGDGIVANVLGRRADKAEAAGTGAASGKMAEIMAALGGTFPEAPGATAQAAPMDYPSQRVAQAHAPAGDMTAYQKAIASIESAGSGDYAAVGPTHPELGRALGKYQVMEANVGPWAKEALGQEITPEQFLQNPEMQDAVFNSQFGKYVQQYGDPEKAAQAWFGGPGGVGKTNRQDSLGTSIGEYGQKFSQALGQPPQPAQQAGGIDPVLEALGARAIPKDGPSMEMLMGAAGDQWMNDSQKGIVEALLSKKLNPPSPKYDFMAGKDGSIFRANETDGSINQVYGGKPDTFRVLTPEEKAQFGLPPDGSFQIGADNKISKIGGEGTTVNIDSKTEGAFDKKLAEKDAEVYSTLSTDGMNAKADLGIIGELGSLLQGQGGTMTGVAGWLAQKGIGTEGMGDLQAAQALINKLIPTQRQPGSGSMSDRDVELFSRSLPSLWNVPGGNEKILGVMQGLAQYKAAQGQIADQVLSGQLDRQTARKMLSELPNPLAEFRGAGTVKKKTEIDGYIIEEID